MRNVSLVHETSAAWEPATGAQPAEAAAAKIQVDPSAELALIELLERPIERQQGYAIGAETRERELVALVATFVPVTALAIQRRIDVGSVDDRLVRAFHRLSLERRRRLYARLVANRCHQRER